MASRLKIVADSDIPFLEGVLDSYADVVFKKGAEISPADVRDADALLARTRTRCDAALLGGSRVRFIGTATIGYDHIDTDYCRRHGIEVAAAAGCNARGVLQYVMGALAELSRKEGWRPEEKTIGIVGVGNVGGLVAEYAANLGFRVLLCDPPKEETYPGNAFYIPLDELLPQSDIVTLHVPLNRSGKYQTLGMACDTFFGKMREGAVFINTSRGEVVEDGALIDALGSGRIGAAVIDTWNGEPFINGELLDMATFATPHIAGYSIQGKANGTAAVVRALGRRFGLPLTGWYPPQAKPAAVNPDITWEELQRTIGAHFDIAAETAALKARPELFEEFRCHYRYREEYF